MNHTHPMHKRTHTHTHTHNTTQHNTTHTTVDGLSNAVTHWKCAAHAKDILFSFTAMFPQDFLKGNSSHIVMLMSRSSGSSIVKRKFPLTKPSIHDQILLDCVLDGGNEMKSQSQIHSELNDGNVFGGVGLLNCFWFHIFQTIHCHLPQSKSEALFLFLLSLFSLSSTSDFLSFIHRTISADESQSHFCCEFCEILHSARQKSKCKFFFMAPSAPGWMSFTLSTKSTKTAVSVCQFSADTPWGFARLCLWMQLSMWSLLWFAVNHIKNLTCFCSNLLAWSLSPSALPIVLPWVFDLLHWQCCLNFVDVLPPTCEKKSLPTLASQFSAMSILTLISSPVTQNDEAKNQRQTPTTTQSTTTMQSCLCKLFMLWFFFHSANQCRISFVLSPCCKADAMPAISPTWRVVVDDKRNALFWNFN